MKFILALAVVLLAPLARAGENCNWNTDHDCPWQCWYDKFDYGGSAQPGDNEAIVGGPNNGLMAANHKCAIKRGGNGIPIRTNAVGGVGAIVFAEDFEDPDYGNVSGTGDGWNSGTGAVYSISGFRGDAAAWVDRYGFAGTPCGWVPGYPLAGDGHPAGSIQCNTSNGAWCGVAEWTSGAENMPDNATGPGLSNQGGPCIDIFGGTNQKFNQEDIALGVPDCPGADGLPNTGDDIANCSNQDGVFDGLQALRYRNPNTGGTQGFSTNDDPSHFFLANDASKRSAMYFGSHLTNLGVTKAVVYPDNQASNSGIYRTAWKSEEFGGVSGQEREFWLDGGPQGQSTPVGGFMFTAPGACVSPGNPVGCNTATSAANAITLAGVTCAVGSLRVNNPGSSVSVELHSVFTPSVDTPDGKWFCLQGQITGMNTGAMRIRKWLNGKTTPVFDCTIDAAYIRNKYYDSMVFGNYANDAIGNCSCGAGCGCGLGWASLASRGIDNYVVTDGAPVSCGEIGGVGGSVGGPSISPPSLQTGGASVSEMLHRLFHNPHMRDTFNWR
jgi:hypothetical protein